jgi:hypothetical protein
MVELVQRMLKLQVKACEFRGDATALRACGPCGLRVAASLDSTRRYNPKQEQH